VPVMAACAPAMGCLAAEWQARPTTPQPRASVAGWPWLDVTGLQTEAGRQREPVVTAGRGIRHPSLRVTETTASVAH
jgi:hypothetical protein